MAQLSITITCGIINFQLMTAWKISVPTTHLLLTLLLLQFPTLLTQIQIDYHSRLSISSFSDSFSDCYNYQLGRWTKVFRPKDKTEISSTKRLVRQHAASRRTVTELFWAKRSTHCIRQSISGLVRGRLWTRRRVAIFWWFEICSTSEHGAARFSITLSDDPHRCFPQHWFRLRISSKLVRWSEMWEILIFMKWLQGSSRWRIFNFLPGSHPFGRNALMHQRNKVCGHHGFRYAENTPTALFM